MFWWLAYSVILLVTALVGGSVWGISGLPCWDACFDALPPDPPIGAGPVLISSVQGGLGAAFVGIVSGGIPAVGVMLAVAVVVLTTGLSRLGSTARGTAQTVIIVFLATAVGVTPEFHEIVSWAVITAMAATFIAGSVIANSI